MITTLIAAIVTGAIGLGVFLIKRYLTNRDAANTPAVQALKTDDAMAKIAANPPSDDETAKRMKDGSF